MHNDNHRKEPAPIGDRIRNFLEEPMNDRDKKSIQLHILDEIFMNTANVLPETLEKRFKDIFNRAARFDKADDKNFFIIQALTFGDYSPTVDFKIPIATEFTDFTWDDIHSLKGYIKLHEVARDCNFAINIEYLVEKGPNGMVIPPRMSINASKSYQDGIMLYPSVYPHLPERKAQAEPKRLPAPAGKKPESGSFKF